MFSFTSSIPVLGVPLDGHVSTPSDKLKTQHGDSGSNVGSDDGAEKNLRILNCIISGGIGGAIGDSIMHSLDTVKTRQQGAPTIAKYKNMISAYRCIAVEEGFKKGLYSGYSAAMLGSLPSAAVFFGTYEFLKRLMVDVWGVNETASYLTAGFFGDLFSSIVYVPSEVLKTRLQLQGRYNNLQFKSGYNYRNLLNAFTTIVRMEGYHALFFGYKATLSRDLPFSAFQFAFYERFRKWAFEFEGKSNDRHLSFLNEIVTGAAAGGLAGVITTPLDVIKTRIQTQSSQPIYNTEPVGILPNQPVRLSNSIIRGLLMIYKTERFAGLLSGVCPRFIWTSVQSSIMLLFYQKALMTLNNYGNTLPILAD